MTTDRQKRAIWFCDRVLSDKFKGDIDNFKEVSEYLSQYLGEAKKKIGPRKHSLTAERLCDYNRYISEDDFEDIDNPHWIVE